MFILPEIGIKGESRQVCLLSLEPQKLNYLWLPLSPSDLLVRNKLETPFEAFLQHWSIYHNHRIPFFRESRENLTVFSEVHWIFALIQTFSL